MHTDVTKLSQAYTARDFFFDLSECLRILGPTFAFAIIGSGMKNSRD